MEKLFFKGIDKVKLYMRPLAFFILRFRTYKPSKINGPIKEDFFKKTFRINSPFSKCELLGQTIDLNEISWEFDYQSKFKFDNKVFFKIRASKYFFNGVDIKNAWEVGRLPFLLPLAISANNNNDPKLYTDVVMSWLENSRFLHGVNWLCAMDVSIRMSNLAVSYRLLKPELKSEFLENKISIELKKSCRFVLSQLERKSNGFVWNHTTANYSGLFIVACLMPEWSDSLAIAKFARDGLEYCIGKQTYSDGTNFEASSFYHRLGIELFAYPLLIGEEKDTFFSETYKNILIAQFYYIFTLRNPLGIIPQLGDNDSGRLFYDFKENGSDTRYLDNLYVEIFQNNLDIKNNPLNGKNSNIPVISRKSWSFNLDVTYFVASKVIVIKNENYHFIAYCFPSGAGGKGGHNHQDTGAYVLSVGKNYQVTDPGTFTYTRSKRDRDRFRSFSSHNVVIPKISDYDLSSTPIFRLEEFILVEDIIIDDNKLILNLLCKKNHIKINRTFCFRENSIIVTDSSESEIISYLNIDMPGAFSDIETMKLRRIEDDFMVVNIKCGSLTEKKSEYSPAYGVNKPIKNICLYSKQKQKDFLNEVEYFIK